MTATAVNPSTSTLVDALDAFVQWRRTHLAGDEKGEAQVFLDHLFRALGHGGIHEAGATLEGRIKKRDEGGTAFADLIWKPRVLIEMKKAGADLRRHYRQAFDYWVRAVPDRPRYVILCNFDEFWVYDFDAQLDEPVDRVPLDELPKRWESIAFMLPREQRPVFANDLVAVTREAAARVAKVLNSMIARGVERHDAQRFVLQCVMAMFAEDVRLLPAHFFTQALHDTKSGPEAFDTLGQLFAAMNTTGTTAGGRFKGTPYFNGGLFATAAALELTDGELELLREAAATNWSDVRPEIFGTLFEGSMNAGERHATGAHYTSQADIAMIVRPVVVEPWRARIDSARSVPDVEKVLNDMSQYRVLDPACGSGNFLYVAYREMRRLEHEAVQKLLSLRRGRAESTFVAFARVQPDHFLGLDVNEFAVEVAKVTLHLAKKLAADELGDEDDSAVLPLDNLDRTIVATDALFSPWPRADAIIGNPPYLGRRKMVEELGAAYCARLADAYPEVGGVSDFVTYWFPLAHDHLPDGGRAGLVATKSIKQGTSRAVSLDYIVDHAGTIIEAVSHVPWSGEAAVTVSIVNWQNGGTPPNKKALWVENGQQRIEVDHITSSLSPEIDLRRAQKLYSRNAKTVFQGQTLGVTEAFKISSVEAGRIARLEPAARAAVHPILGGDELLKRTSVDDWVIDIPEPDSDLAHARFPLLMKSLEPTALAVRAKAAVRQQAANAQVAAEGRGGRTNNHHINFLKRWWMLGYRREEMLDALSGLERYVAVTRTSSELRGPIFAFIDGSFRVADSMVAFPFADDYSLGVLQSAAHVRWFRERCTTLETRLTYTSTTVWDTFPWPQRPSPQAVEKVATAAAAINNRRAEGFRMGQTFAAMYDALRKPGQSTLRALHERLDAAVLEAYGFDRDEDLLTQLFELNLSIATRIADGEEVTLPGPQPGAVTASTWRFPAPKLPDPSS